MTKEFKSEVGTIYLEYAKDDKVHNVWFEEFCIIGQGATEAEALKDAVRCGTDIADLAARAIGELELRS